MKLRKLVTKVMSMALACVMLATTVPMLADVVTDKPTLDMKWTNPADTLVLSTEDNEAIWKELGATSITGAEIVVLDENSGLCVDTENSVISGFAGTTGTALNNVYAIELYGISVSRNDEGNLEFDPGWHTYCSTECYVNTSDYSVSNVSTWDTTVKFEGDTIFNYADLASDLIAEKGHYDYWGNDIFHVRYYYLDENGNSGWYGDNFILAEHVEDSIFNFVEPEVPSKPETPTTPEVPSVPETPSEPETPSVDDSYEVELPADNTAISSTDFSAILTENATKDVVIESNEKVTFTFAKGTMSAVDGMENYDFGTSVVNDFASAGAMDTDVTADNFVTRINFNYSGKLPATASIKIFVGTEYAGKTLYYHKLAESGLTYITSAEVDAEGYIVVTQDSCSDYVLTTEKLVIEAPQTGDSSSVALWMMVAICGLGCVVCGLKSKKLA